MNRRSAIIADPPNPVVLKLEVLGNSQCFAVMELRAADLADEVLAGKNVLSYALRRLAEVIEHDRPNG